MPIGEQSPIASHTGNGVATVFAYSFGVLAADDIMVLLDGIEVTTGFTVAGIGSRTGGTVTFAAPPANGVDILIVREVVRARSTDYQYSGDLREEVLDDDFDRIWMTLQEDGELVQRGVRAPVGETLSELPAASSRVDKVLTFGPGGAIALVDIAAFTGGGIVELVPADGSIAMVKLTTAVQNLINGALQMSGGTMLADIILAGNTAQDLGAVPKQQAESIAAQALADAKDYTDAAQTTTEAKLIGVSQSWQAVTRAGGTTYFNTTGRPIQLLLSGATSGAGVVGIFYVAINGGANLPIGTAGGAGIPQTTLSGVITIPVGASYVVTYNNIAGGPSAYELR